MADLRIRIDDQFGDLLMEFRELGYFLDLSSIVMFAACLGFSNRTREDARGTKDVRVAVLLSTPGAEELLNALAVASGDDLGSDPLGEEALGVRAKIFEQYVNGGLKSLDEIRSKGKTLAVAIPTLVHAGFALQREI